jgi:hypothetical protein
VCGQLEEKGLLQLMRNFTGGGDVAGHARLSAQGIDVAEGTRESPITIVSHQDHSTNYTVSNAQNVAFGDNNVQSWQVQFDALVKAIDASSAGAEEKQDAKSKLKAFLAHPIVAAIVGGLAAKG